MHWKLKKQGFVLWSLSLIVSFALWTLAGWATAAPAAIAVSPVSNKLTSDIVPIASGREVFQDAYEQRYTWDEDFPGYQAEVSVSDRGKLEQGLVRIAAPDLKISVLNIEDEDIRDLVKAQLQMEVVHRKSVPFEVLHADRTFKIEDTDRLGAAIIKEIGDDAESSYKVQDNQITEVNRLFGDVAVTVDTVGTIKTPDGYLPTHTKSVFRNAKTGEIIEKDDVRDFYEKIGNYYLLTNRTIRRTTEGDPELKVTPDTTIRFNDVQPLS